MLVLSKPRNDCLTGKEPNERLTVIFNLLAKLQAMQTFKNLK